VNFNNTVLSDLTRKHEKGVLLKILSDNPDICSIQEVRMIYKNTLKTRSCDVAQPNATKLCYIFLRCLEHS